VIAQGTILVTGAAGFVGGHLLKGAAGRRPIIAWRRPGGTKPAESDGVEWRAVDLEDSAAVATGVAEAAPAAIVHLAGAPSVRTSWQTVVPHLRINVMGTHHLLQAVRRAGRPCRVLVVSSAQVYRPDESPTSEESPLQPPNPYGLSKLAEEQLALRAAADDGLDIVIARPFNHIGPRQSAEFAVSHFARQIARIEAGLEAPSLRVGNLATRRDTLDVRDVVDAYLLLVDRAERGRTYNICSGQAPVMRDLLDGLLARSQAAVELAVADDRLRPNDAPVVLGDPTRISTEIGWTPKIALSQTLADILDDWRARVAADPHA
jgi:GDP-4-dehydro-6-deoxy-D-mannose reductase